MKKEEICAYLAAKGISYERTEHMAVFTVEEAESISIPHPECNAKNLFLRDDKKRSYYLFTLPYDCALTIKELRAAVGARPLRFASEEELYDILGLQKGSVTPLGLLNDREKKVRFYLDAAFRGKFINIHPNENTATIRMAADDLVALLAAHGTETQYLTQEA